MSATVTIAAGQSLSSPVALGADAVAMVIAPAGVDESEHLFSNIG
jgi:hypothetical protein